jgi:hypothetical protein
VLPLAAAAGDVRPAKEEGGQGANFYHAKGILTRGYLLEKQQTLEMTLFAFPHEARVVDHAARTMHHSVCEPVRHIVGAKNGGRSGKWVGHAVLDADPLPSSIWT